MQSVFIPWNSLQVPRGAYGFAQQAICLLIVDKTFFVRIPVKCAIESHGNIGQVTDAGRAMPHFYRSDRIPSRLDAVQEITFMVTAFIEMDFVRSDHGVHEGFGVRTKGIPVNVHLTFGTLEPNRAPDAARRAN